MKKLLMPLAVIAALATSCSTDTDNNYSTYGFREFNLIADTQDENSTAYVNGSVYSVKMNWNYNTAELSTSNLVINNNTISFETNPMPLGFETVKDPYSDFYAQMGMFSSKENVGKGASVTNLSAIYTNGVYNVPMNIPGFTSPAISELRLLLDYTLDERYRVRTFWSECFYVGDTDVNSDAGNYSTQTTTYRVQLDLKKMTAKVVVYAPKFSGDTPAEDMPDAFVLSELPVTLTHDSYVMRSESPKTEIMISTPGKTELKEPGKYQISDFSFSLTSADLTDARISFTVDGKNILFNGSSIAKKKN